MKLFHIIQKNLRLVFRNWTSFLLLVLGPLFLILIVGLAFSGDDLHDIKIGVHAEKGADIEVIVSSLTSAEVNVVPFKSINTCIEAMTHTEIHICAEFSKNFGDGSGDVTFYYDATRYNLVRYILEYLDKKIAITSEQISLSLAEEIFKDIDLFVSDMKTGQMQVHELRDNALLLKKDLVSLYEEVVYAREEFEPSYFRIKELQQELNDTAVIIGGDYAGTANVTEVLHDLYAMQSAITNVNATVTFAENYLISSGVPYDHFIFQQLYTSINEAVQELENTIYTLQTTGDLESVTLNQIYDLLDNINEIVGYLDQAYSNLLNIEISLKTHIENIDAGVANLDGLSESFDIYIEEFSSINEEDADKFLHPISATFVAVPDEEEFTKLQVVFPMLLIFMITFISVMLSNMLVLNETHSPAYFRNFLLPINHFWFILGLFITTLVMIGMQLAVLLLVAYFSFGVVFTANTPVFFAAVLLSVIVFIEIGMIFGYIIKQRQTSLLTSLFFALILFFFSDIVFPLEIMPIEAAFFAQFSPLVVAEGLFREVLFFGHGIPEQIFGFGVLLLYAVFFGILTVLAYYLNRSRR